MKQNLLVGVTGGIGSGKSAVCELFEQLGRTVISADLLARRLTTEDEQIKTEIRSVFGSSVFDRKGGLDRGRLADLVFTDPRSLKRLNAIVHPRVFDALHEHIALLSPRQRTPYVIIEAALIYESGLDKQLDFVIVVDADEEQRISRIMKRDGLERDRIVDRMRSQIPVERKIRLADFVIRNNGTLQELRPKVRFLDLLLTRMSTPLS